MRKFLIPLLTFTPFVALAVCAGDEDTTTIFHNLLGIPGVCTVPDLMYALIDVGIKLLVPIIAILIIFTGFEFATAKGDAAKIKKARTSLTWVIIGTLVIFGAKGMGLVLQSTINSVK